MRERPRLARARRVRGPALAVLVLLGAGCATLVGVEPLNILSTPQEVEMGAEVAKQIEAREKVLDNPAVQAYVSRVGRQLAAAAPRQDVKYTFTVIDNDKSVNAFALPGGHLYVYTGLMRVCENEAELASVLAHEVAHVAAHHHGEMITRLYGYEFLVSLILGRDPGTYAKLAADLAGSLGALHYSRDNEREADRLGMAIMVRAGYNPDAMLSFMQKLLAEDRRRGGRGLAIFSSHPPTSERLALLGALAQRYPPETRQGRLYAERYRTECLARLSPPAK